MITCYSRRMSDYLYDIEIDETTRALSLRSAFALGPSTSCDWSLVTPCRWIPTHCADILGQIQANAKR